MSQIGIDSHHVVTTFLVVFDLTGTFIFALSGAIAAVKHRLDAFGILVLCFVTGNAGGITRDIMIGALPPAAINEWRYVAVSIVAGVIVFFGYPVINRLSSPVLLFDAAGLGLFCVADADKALAFHAGPVAAILLGMTAGIGGGMVRDVLVMEIPTVLRTELYAVAALLGAAFHCRWPALRNTSACGGAFRFADPACGFLDRLRGNARHFSRFAHWRRGEISDERRGRMR